LLTYNLSLFVYNIYRFILLTFDCQCLYWVKYYSYVIKEISDKL